MRRTTGMYLSPVVFEVAQAKSGNGELFHFLVVCRNQALSAAVQEWLPGSDGASESTQVHSRLSRSTVFIEARECIAQQHFQTQLGHT